MDVMRVVPLVLVALSLAVPGCRHLAERPDHCSGDVAATHGRTGTLHVRAELSRHGRVQRHEAIVQILPDRVSLVGLTPMGTQAFELTRGPDGLTVDNRVGQYIGMTPLLLHDAIARAYLAEGGPGGEGEQRYDTWHAGQLERRRFLPLSRWDRGAATVTYAAPAAGGGAEVRNEWCDYEARIVVVSDDRASP